VSSTRPRTRTSAVLPTSSPARPPGRPDISMRNSSRVSGRVNPALKRGMVPAKFFRTLVVAKFLAAVLAFRQSMLV